MSDRLPEIVKVLELLPPNLQQEVYDFARFLLVSRLQPVTGSENNPAFYLCPICFNASGTPQICHEHLMMPVYDTTELEQKKPLVNEQGTLKGRAPRWFLEAIRTMRGRQ